jgi:hypothetical protein
VVQKHEGPKKTKIELKVTFKDSPLQTLISVFFIHQIHHCFYLNDVGEGGVVVLEHKGPKKAVKTNSYSLS